MDVDEIREMTGETDVARMAQHIAAMVQNRRELHAAILADPTTSVVTRVLSGVKYQYEAARRLDANDELLPIALEQLIVACEAAIKILTRGDKD